MSRFPMPRYPNGWFQVAYANELAPGAVKPLRYFGKDLVLFRTEGGEAKLLDAHCPHLGAHLGHGGKVKGDCIECPFHAWKFDGAGARPADPHGKKRPPPPPPRRREGAAATGADHPPGRESIPTR